MPFEFEKTYCELIENVIDNGAGRDNTRNHPTLSVFGQQIHFDELRTDHIPLIKGRTMYPKGVIGEFAAFLNGIKTVNDFKKFECNFWDQWADKEGNLTVDYGNVWRDFEGCNQLSEVVNSLKNTPGSRRMIISNWRPHKINELSLPCCHCLYQWRVNPTPNKKGETELDMLWWQRSVDVMVGLPSNALSASIFNTLMAKTVGMVPGRVTMQFGDTHIYKNHLENAEKYLQQVSNTNNHAPRGYLLPNTSFEHFTQNSYVICAYNPQPKISFEVHS
jgi:thymidylate synthase